MSLAAIFETFGPPHEVVQLKERQLPEVQNGQVRLKLLASAINPADLNYIEGRYGVRPDLPATPGMEGCALVIESKAEGFATGDHVIFLRRGGAWADELIASSEDLVKISSEIDPLQAAMLAVNPLTAYVMMKDFVTLDKGDVILQNAANSNVGRCVIQLAKIWGIQTVNTVRREGLAEELEALGADHVRIDDRALRSEVQALGLPEPKLALNCVGGDSALTQLKLLAEKGVQATYGAMARQPYQIPNGLLIFKRVSLHGFWVSKWIEEQRREVVDAAYAELAEFVKKGSLIQAVEKTYRLDELPLALEHAAQNKRSGKILLKW